MMWQSRRKLRTTRPSIRPWKCISRSIVTGAVALATTCAPALAADWQANPSETSRASVQREQPLSLGALKNRSAKARWKSLRERRDTSPSSASESGELPSLVGPAVELGGDSAEAQKSAERRIETTAMRRIPDLSGAMAGDEFLPPFPGDVMRTAEAQPPVAEDLPEQYAPPIDSPADLKSVRDILPFYDYEPDPEVRAEDPCRYLCPRPDGAPCEPYAEGTEAPECPEEIALSDDAYVDRLFAESLFAWAPSNLYHNPLYFEDVQLERYGHTYGCLVQPFASVGKFSLQLLGFPYQATIDPSCKKMYTLGYYRPGECAPKLHYQIPWNTHAAAVQAGVTTGMFYIFP